MFSSIFVKDTQYMYEFFLKQIDLWLLLLSRHTWLAMLHHFEKSTIANWIQTLNFWVRGKRHAEFYTD